MAGNIGGYVAPVTPPPGLLSGTLIANAVTSGFIASGAVQGQTGGGNLNIASGTISTYDLASGTTARASLFTSVITSGTTWSVITGEIVSGIRAVSISQSGFLQIAKASVSGKYPAVGVVIDNVLSGIPVNVYVNGFILATSGLCDFSGFIGNRLFLGRSGQITNLSTSWSSGGFASGDIGQVMGTAVTSGAFVANVFPFMWSGGPAGIPVGGPF